MKLLRRAALGLAVVTAFAVAPQSAQAAGPYTILTHGTAPFTASGYAWEATRCGSAFLSSAANGIEARVVDVSALAGRTVRLSWSTVTPGVGGIFGQAKAYSSACAAQPIASSDYSLTSNTMTIHIPAGTRWALFSAFGSANISFTVS